MTETTEYTDLNDALAGLLDKYSVKPPSPWRIVDGSEPPPDVDDLLMLVPGESLTESELPARTVPLPARTVPLPAWRYQRRFVELKRLVDEETVAPLLMCRFACLTDGRQLPLQAILYREFDLVEWLSGAPVVGVHASMAGDQAANIIVRLTSGVIASVEAGTTLPAGATIQDRHEMIARRGVACDRVVDTQVAQSSVYCWSDDGHRQHTDVDAELFGLDVEQAALVRSAHDVLCRPDRAAALRTRHRRLRQLVELAYESDRRRERLKVEP